MSTEHTEFLWMDADHAISVNELLELTGLASHELEHLVQCGALMPENPEDQTWYFQGHWITSIQTLTRLKRDFELEPNSYALTLVFLERIRKLEAQLKLRRDGTQVDSQHIDS